MLTLGSFELTAGAELRLPDPVIVPFVAIAWYEQDWWSVLEVRAPFLLPELTPDRGFTAALSVGIRW